MDNSQMNQLITQFMQDPEVLSAIQKPDVFQKLQNLLNNPGQAAELMQDPEIAPIFARFQSMGMGYQAEQKQQNAHIVQIRDNAHFDQILAAAGTKKVVVVDFYTTWCGPCKLMAPYFEQLANNHHANAVFVKVDGDRCGSLTQSKAVSAFPTFQFYHQGKLLDSFSGADVNRLTATVERLVKTVTVEAPCPHKHFPLKETEVVLYKTCRYDSVVRQLLKANSSTNTGETALTDKDQRLLEDFVRLLESTDTYQTSVVTEEMFAFMDKLLTVPYKQVGSALHLARMVIRHPGAAKHYAEQFLSDEKKGDIVTKLVEIAIRDLDRNVPPILCLRALCNTFARRSFALAMAKKYEKVLDPLSPLLRNTDTKISLTFVALLINYAILFREDAKAYEEPKVTTMSMIVDVLVPETDPVVLYRVLVVLGTLVYRDPAAIEMANGLEVQAKLDIIRNAYAKRTGADADNLNAVTYEIGEALKWKPSK